MGRSKQDEPGGDKESELSKEIYLPLRYYKFVVQICTAAVSAECCLSFSDTQYSVSFIQLN